MSPEVQRVLRGRAIVPCVWVALPMPLKAFRSFGLTEPEDSLGMSITTSKGSRSRSSENRPKPFHRSEEHTSELQSLMRISYAVFCLKKKITKRHILTHL